VWSPSFTLHFGSQAYSVFGSVSKLHKLIGVGSVVGPVVVVSGIVSLSPACNVGPVVVVVNPVVVIVIVSVGTWGSVDFPVVVVSARRRREPEAATARSAMRKMQPAASTLRDDDRTGAIAGLCGHEWSEAAGQTEGT